MGKFMNLQREKPWDAAEKKVVMEMLEKWTKNSTWSLADVKGGVQAFSSERGVDLSIKRIITEEYMLKIKENKMSPVAFPRNRVPAYAILGVSLAALYAS